MGKSGRCQSSGDTEQEATRKKSGAGPESYLDFLHGLLSGQPQM